MAVWHWRIWRIQHQQLEGDVDGNKLGPPHYGNQLQEQIQQLEALLRPVTCQSEAKGLGCAVSTLTAWERSGTLMTCRPLWKLDKPYHVQIAFEESSNQFHGNQWWDSSTSGPFLNLSAFSEPVLPRVSDCANTATAARPELWRHWARVCSESHKQCKHLRQHDGFSPKRLIEIIPDWKTGRTSPTLGGD